MWLVKHISTTSIRQSKFTNSFNANYKVDNIYWAPRKSSMLSRFLEESSLWAIGCAAGSFTDLNFALFRSLPFWFIAHLASGQHPGKWKFTCFLISKILFLSKGSRDVFCGLTIKLISSSSVKFSIARLIPSCVAETAVFRYNSSDSVPADGKSLGLTFSSGILGTATGSFLLLCTATSRFFLSLLTVPTNNRCSFSDRLVLFSRRWSALSSFCSSLIETEDQ